MRFQSPIPLVAMLPAVLLLCGVRPLNGLPEAPPLPDDGFRDGWQVVEGSFKRFPAQELYGYINGGAELYLEYGFEEVRAQHYSHGELEVGLDVYEMTGPVAALGIYLAKCGKETPSPRLHVRNTAGSSQVLAVKGNYFIKANSYNRGANLEEVVTDLAAAFLAAVEPAPETAIFSQLPPEHLVAGSEKLVRGEFALQPFYTFGEGDILQLGGDVFGVTGRYETPDGATFHRLVIEYPSADRARNAFANLVANLDSYLDKVTIAEDYLIFKDYNNLYGLAELDGAKLAIRVGLEALPE